MVEGEVLVAVCILKPDEAIRQIVFALTVAHACRINGPSLDMNIPYTHIRLYGYMRIYIYTHVCICRYVIFDYETGEQFICVFVGYCTV